MTDQSTPQDAKRLDPGHAVTAVRFLGGDRIACEQCGRAAHWNGGDYVHVDPPDKGPATPGWLDANRIDGTPPGDLNVEHRLRCHALEAALELLGKQAREAGVEPFAHDAVYFAHFILTGEARPGPPPQFPAPFSDDEFASMAQAVSAKGPNE